VVDGRLDKTRSSNTNETFKSTFTVGETGVEILDGKGDNDGMTVRHDDGKTVGTGSGVDVGTGHHDADETVGLSFTFTEKLEDGFGNLGTDLADPFLINGKETVVTEDRAIDNTTGFFTDFIDVELHVVFEFLEHLFDGFFSSEVTSATADTVQDLLNNLIHTFTLLEEGLTEVFESLNDKTEVSNSGNVGSLVRGEASVDGTGDGRNIRLSHLKLSLKAKIDEVFVLGEGIPLRVLTTEGDIGNSTKDISDTASGLLHAGNGGVHKGTKSRVSEGGNLVVFFFGKLKNDATKSSFSGLRPNENRESSNTEFILFFLVEIDALNNGLDGTGVFLSGVVKSVDGNLTHEVNIFRDIFMVVTFSHLFELVNNGTFTINVGNEDLDGFGMGEAGKGLDVDGLLVELGSMVETLLDQFNVWFSLAKVFSAFSIMSFIEGAHLNLLAASVSGGLAVSTNEVTKSNTSSREDKAISSLFLSGADITDKIEDGLSGLDESGLKVFESNDSFEGGESLSLDLFNKEFSGFFGSSKSSNINKDLTLHLLKFRFMVLTDLTPKLDEVLLGEDTHTHGELDNLVSSTTLKFDVVRNNELSEGLDQSFNLSNNFLTFGLAEESKIFGIKLLLVVFFRETEDESFVLLGVTLESLAPITLNLTFTGKTDLDKRDGSNLLLTKGENLLVKSLSLVELHEFTLVSTTVLSHVVVVGSERFNKIVLGVEVDGAAFGLDPISHFRLHIAFNGFRKVIGANIFASARIVTAEDKASFIIIIALHVVDGLGEIEVITMMFFTVDKDIVGGLAMTVEAMFITGVDNGFFTMKLLLLFSGGAANSKEISDGTIDIDNFLGHLLRSFKLLELIVATKIYEHGSVLFDGLLRGVRDTNGTGVVFNLLVERTSIHMTKLESEDTETFSLLNLDGKHSILFKTSNLLVLTRKASGNEGTVGEIVFLAVFENFRHEVIVGSTTEGSSQGNESRKSEENPHFVLSDI